MQYARLLLPAVVVAAMATACSGTGDDRQLPASPLAPGDVNSADISAPVPQSPSDDSQVGGLQPTLTVANATSNGSGARTYEFSLSDDSNFGQTPATLSLAGIPEGGNGQTSFTPPTDLLPATRYYWRARALQAGSIGPWSNTSRFRTRVDSFKSGNRAFDILSNGITVADETRNVSLIDEGAKLDANDSYLMYRLSTLQEGEISFIAFRVKPEQNGRIITIQDGTGDFNSNPWRVMVEKRPRSEGGRIAFQFAGGATVYTGGIGWADRRDYFFRLEWRAGSARLRVFNGTSASGGPFVDLSTSYGAPFNATAPVVTIGARTGSVCEDIRVRRLYIGAPDNRPVALSSDTGQ
jgi:hypothetical protein